MMQKIFNYNKFNDKSSAGYSLVEMLIYISILSIICVIVVNTILSFTQSYRTLGALRMLDHSASNSLERMTRDVQSASSVDTTKSVLGSSPGVLTLTTTGTTTKFYIFNNSLHIDVNNASSGPLTLSKSSITNLIFTRLNNSTSTAVKIDMTISATNGPVVKTKTYHSTVVLKGQ